MIILEKGNKDVCLREISIDDVEDGQVLWKGTADSYKLVNTKDGGIVKFIDGLRIKAYYDVKSGKIITF